MRNEGRSSWGHLPPPTPPPARASSASLPTSTCPTPWPHWPPRSIHQVSLTHTTSHWHSASTKWEMVTLQKVSGKSTLQHIFSSKTLVHPRVVTVLRTVMLFNPTSKQCCNPNSNCCSLYINWGWKQVICLCYSATCCLIITWRRKHQYLKLVIKNE